MNTERFQTLAEAFGGDVARWPAVDRDAAAALMAADPAWAATVLAQASALDELLGECATPQPSATLAHRIVAGAPRSRAGRRWIGWLLPAGMGAGLAAACAAGMVMGSQLSTPAVTTPDSAAEAMVAAFSDDDVSLYLDEEA